MSIPESLFTALRPVTVIVGHYGSGKTNFAVNLAIDLHAAGYAVTLVDLDIVNPYFRASEQRGQLEEAGVELVAPVFSEAGTSLDVPSLTGRIEPAITDVNDASFTLIDAGGDDVGATALGRYSGAIRSRDYAMLYVANRFRNLVADPQDAQVNLAEIEAASHLKATALVNNSHLKGETTTDTLNAGIDYVKELAALTSLPIACTTAPAPLASSLPNAYPVSALVKNPWE